MMLLVKLQASACNFTKSITPSKVFSRFLICTNVPYRTNFQMTLNNNVRELSSLIFLLWFTNSTSKNDFINITNEFFEYESNCHFHKNVWHVCSQSLKNLGPFEKSVRSNSRFFSTPSPLLGSVHFWYNPPPFSLLRTYFIFDFYPSLCPLTREKLISQQLPNMKRIWYKSNESFKLRWKRLLKMLYLLCKIMLTIHYVFNN